MLQLPSDWFEKTLDDKMTTMMEQFLSSNMSVNKKLEDLSTQITDLKNSQAATVADLSEVKMSVKTNAESISELNSEIKKLKEDYKSNMNTMHNNLADLNKIVNLENRETSSTSSLSGSTTELVIAGIPNSVADNLSPSEIQSAVLNALELPHLVSDVLSVREFQNKCRPRQDKVNHSYLVDLKSSRVRDFIISSKRKSKNLLAKIMFPDYVDQNFKGAIYINEFLLPEMYKLLLQTKEKAKLKKINLIGHTAQFLNLINDTQPNIIILVETRLKPLHDNSIFLLNGYNIVRRDRTLKHADTGCYIQGGGVACLVHESVEVKVLHISTSDYLNQPEYLIADVTLFSGSHLLLSCIYRRPKGLFLNEFFDIFSRFAPNFNNIIIAGDLNCNLLDDSYTARHLKDFILESSLFCVPYGATFHKNNHDSWLDVILLDSESKLVSFAKSDSPFIDGHDYLFCKYKLNCSKPAPKKVTFRNLKNCDHQALSRTLMNTLRIDNAVLENSDPNELLIIFKSGVLSSLDLFAPEITKKIVRHGNPWFTKELKMKCKERDEIYKKARRTRDLNLLALFRIKRKKLKTELNHAREEYLKTILSNLSYGSSIWSKLKHLGLIKSNPSLPLNFFDALELNEYYANIGRKHPSCDRNFVDFLPENHSRLVECLFNWTKIDIVDVTKALHLTLSKSKGKSPDGLDLRWLRDHLPQISLFLTALFNRSLDTGIFPDIWKIIYIIPLNKIAPPRSPSDTCPIANLSHLAKVFERIIENQVITYLEDNELLDPFQSGFRKHHSTQSALLRLTDDIRQAMDKNKLTIIVLFDLSKAFDYVDPKIILIALFELGYSMETIIWFFSYLSNRSQSILNDLGTPIQLLRTSSGVPQGSVLGPILFLIVMNSVVRWLVYCNYGLFADDKYIYLHFFVYQLQEAVRQVNIDAQSVADWARKHGLEINLSKTKAMILSSNSKLKQLSNFDLPPIIINGVIISYVDTAKCLGLHISRNLSWNYHFKLVVSKINLALHSLKVRKNIFSTDIRKLLVSSTILPLIDYCSIVLVDSTSENDLKLQRAINCSIRFIFNLKNDEHITPYRRELGWLTVKYRRMYFMSCFFFKLLQVGKPKYLRDSFVEETEVRRSDRLAAKKHSLYKFPHFATTFMERSFQLGVIRLWEELPEEIVNSSSLEVFKNKISRKRIGPGLTGNFAGDRTDGLFEGLAGGLARTLADGLAGNHADGLFRGLADGLAKDLAGD
ncbi:uncharacterized protein LOC123266005 [Cotesia glomerata]|uniref:uncharacterized protein LOC123266005 n=1 Tax=Cotesia glomerata TaxID=32391 RepID=UPI001D00E151|nr:uncharacterized protein LOC123266005 [Cotesia glomerata]